MKVNHWSFSCTTGRQCRIAVVRRYPEFVCGQIEFCVVQCWDVFVQPGSFGFNTEAVNILSCDQGMG